MRIERFAGSGCEIYRWPERVTRICLSPEGGNRIYLSPDRVKRISTRLGRC
jgi:hypothetical protein